MVSGLIYLMLVSYILGVTHGLQDVTRLNYGVLFHRVSQLQFAKDFWTNTFEIHLPDDYNSTTTFRHCTDQTSECLVKNHFLSQVNHLQRQTQIGLENTNKFIRRLVPETDFIQNNSGKRGLFNFISDIGQSWFGLGRDADVQTIARHVNQLTHDANRVNQVLTQYGNHFSSYVAGVNHKLKTLTNEILLNKHGLEILRTRLKDTQEAYQRTFGTMTGIAMEQLSHYSDVHFELDQLKFGIIDLVQGNLSPIIITPQILAKALRDLQLLLDSKYHGYYVMNDDPHYYYKFSQFMLARKGSTLYVSLKIPVTGYKYPFNVFSITIVEVPVNSSSPHVTQLLEQPDFLLLSRDHSRYTTLMSSEYSSCIGSSFRHCFQRAVIKSSLTNPSCILSIFKNEVASVRSLCDFRVLQSTLKPHVLELSNNKLLVYRLPTLSLHCSEGSRQLKGCSNFCIVTLPCNCAIDTDQLHFSGHITNCPANNNHTKLHPINMAMIQEFFNHSYIQNLACDSYFNATMNISVPAFKIYEHDFSQVIADDRKTDLSLKKIAKAAKTDEKIFTSLAHSVVSGAIPLPSTWSSHSTIIFVVIGCVTVLNFLITIWLMYKFRTLRAAILFHRVSATLPTAFVYEAMPTIPTPTVIQYLQSNIAWDHAIFLLTILNLIFILYFCRRSLKSSGRQTSIVIEVNCPHACILVPIFHLPLCPSFYLAAFPSQIENLRVNGHLRPKLHVSWPGFAMRSILDNTRVSIPTEIRINPYTAWRLRQILRSKFNMHFYIHHKGLLQRTESSSYTQPLIPPSDASI